jgi:transcription antitermination factor NusG
MKNEEGILILNQEKKEEFNLDHNLNYNWYIVKCRWGQEKNFQAELLDRIKKNNLEKYFKEIKIIHKITTNDKKKIVLKNRYSGCLFVNLHANFKTLGLIKDTIGFVNFLGTSNNLQTPKPLSDLDVRKFIHITKNEDKTLDVKGGDKVNFNVGDEIKILLNGLEDKKARVQKVNYHNKTITAEIYLPSDTTISIEVDIENCELLNS